MNNQAIQDQRPEQPVRFPEVGMGVTGQIYTDCDALTITRIGPSGKTFWATIDDAELVPDWKPDITPGGFVGHCNNNYTQRYYYQSRPDGQEIRFTLGKDGKWKCSKRYGRVTLGVRRKFHDYNF